mmetsp:Transcript_21755/g.50104  ORF Transcript_21755/g.50104 Transcript_21755/m.50104 type:complete len:274 (-) Transcript_21755:606-1427(-)
MVMNDMNILDHCAQVGLHPAPPSKIDWPAQRLLPDGHICVDSMRVPWLDRVVDHAHERIVHGAILASVQPILAHLPCHALHELDRVAVRVGGRAVVEVCVGAVVHILFLAVGLPWLVVRRGESLVLKLIGAEDVRWVTNGRPVSVEVQAIPPRAAVRVRVDDGHTEHFDVLAVDSDALVGGVVANPDQIWLEVIVGLERAVSANEHVVDLFLCLDDPRAHVDPRLEVDVRSIVDLEHLISSPVVRHAGAEHVCFVGTEVDYGAIDRVRNQLYT